MRCNKAIVEISPLRSINVEREIERECDRCLRLWSMLEQTIGLERGIQVKPQTIVGIPPSTSADQIKWRKNYKKRMADIFESLEYPKPRFWPEPFAVFQYHLNLGQIKDTGRRQNVLVVDIGGELLMSV
tara:strand:+ start:1356 stop:1742 length:387 start_codon:yes stop_codon:yes gene_type:complete